MSTLLKRPYRNITFLLWRFKFITNIEECSKIEFQSNIPEIKGLGSCKNISILK